MGLLDYQQPDPNAQPQTPGFLDAMGGMFGGIGQIDPGMAAQLGIDPQKLQHQMAMQALMRMGAGIAAGGAPHNGHRPTIWEAIANGTGAAQQGGQEQLGNMLRQAYQSKQLSALGEQQKRQEAQNKANDALSQSLQGGTLDPNFVSAMGLDENSLRSLAMADPAKFTSMLTSWNATTSAEKRATDKETAANARQDKLIAQQEANADRRAALAAGAQNALPAIWRNAPPEELDAYRRHMAGMTGDDGMPVLTPREQGQREVRAKEIQQQLTLIDNALTMGQQVGSRFQTGDYDSTGLNHWRNATLPTMLQSTGGQKLGTDAADYMLAAQGALAAPGNRNSVLQLKTLGLSKPSNDKDLSANISAIETNQKLLSAKRQALADEMLHYQSGGKVSNYIPAGVRKSDAGGGARGQGGAQPQALPAGAIARLKANPSEAALFDAQFGPGAAASVLGGQ